MIYDDGGRADAGLEGDAGDCVTRAIAIATGLDYRVVYKTTSPSGRPRGKATLGPQRRQPEGVPAVLFADLGAIWTPTMSIGSGTTVHLDEAELPWTPWLIVPLSDHLAACHNGKVFDTHDPTRNSTASGVRLLASALGNASHPPQQGPEVRQTPIIAAPIGGPGTGPSRRAAAMGDGSIAKARGSS